LKLIVKPANTMASYFGYTCVGDFTQSLFNVKLAPFIGTLSLLITFLSNASAHVIGMRGEVVLAFIFLHLLEFFSGIRAAVKRGEKIQSRKLPRIAIKLATYTAILGVLQTFHRNLDPLTVFGLIEFNLYGWVWMFVFHAIVLQLVVSFFENLSGLGFKETSRIYQVLKNKVGKWIDIKDSTDNPEGNA
jgi:hypothetical protein